MTSLQNDILKTLLYYDIFDYPLKADEVFSFLPSNSISIDTLKHALGECVAYGIVFNCNGYYSVNKNISELVRRRNNMELFAKRRWKIAHVIGHIIKRFPFIRGCFVTGTLSKNISTPACDIDLFIVTKKDRLWIARILLTFFKKIFLLNSKKYFCINYFVSEDALEIHDRNVFTATEIAHVKPLISKNVFDEFLSSNNWIKQYFPNWQIKNMQLSTAHNCTSIFAGIFELPFYGKMGDALDTWLMKKMKIVWKKRYPYLTDEKRDALFRVRKNVSKAHAPDFETRILDAYKHKCLEYGIEFQMQRSSLIHG